jgi:hypothetical protein
MGASTEMMMTDKLGRRSGPRRQYSIAEKRSMVEETHVPGCGPQKCRRADRAHAGAMEYS